MTICAITAFCGRHRNVERVIRHYLDQTYEGKSYLLLYNNSPIEQRLSDIPTSDNKKIILINCDKDLKTAENYTNTGDIFRDALSVVPDGVDVITFMDSDDSFLPSHISEGAIGMEKAKELGCLAYKPYESYFLYENKCGLMHNTLEPSIFVSYPYLTYTGFHPKTVTYHQKWIDNLSERKQLFVDPDGKPTLIYNWQQGHGNHKISGGSDDEANFITHRRWETDNGDGILTPAPPIEAQYFYRLTAHTPIKI